MIVSYNSNMNRRLENALGLIKSIHKSQGGGILKQPCLFYDFADISLIFALNTGAEIFIKDLAKTQMHENKASPPEIILPQFTN